MAKRFRDTGIWDEDWYMSLSGNYMLFWDYICDKCDYAGILRPNKAVFEKLTTFNINLTEFLGYVNSDKERILVLPNGRWFLTGFIVFQYFKKEPCVLSMSNHFHRSIIEQLEKNVVPYKSGCYGFEVKEGAKVGAHLPPKDKDKDKDKDINTSLSSSLKEESEGKTWKDDFSIYQAEEQVAYESLINDPVWTADRQKYHPNLDIKLSAEKAHKDYWSTEAAWSHKKKQWSKSCDWRRTYNNALTQRCNQVWKNKGPEMAGLFND